MLLLTGLAAVVLLGSSSLAQSNDAPDAACQCVAVDYADGGSYLVNANEDGNFSYASIFEGGCTDIEIPSVLRDPDNNSYECSAVRPGIPGSVQISECGISYFDMKSGVWQIEIHLHGNVTVTRTFTLTVGAASTVVTTVTPTLVIGTTQTPPAQVTSKVTADFTLPQEVVTSTCAAQKTLTTTIRGPPTLVIETQVVLQVAPGGTRTSSITITRTLTGSCRYSAPPSVRTTSSSARPSTSSSRTMTSSTARTTSTLRTSSSVPQRTTVTVTTAAPVASGGLTFTLSGSICGVNWENNGGGWGPPWGRGRGGGWGGGPPPWITSLWQGGVPPWVTQAGGALPTWVSCTQITSSTASRPRRSASPAIRMAWTSTYVQTTYTETLLTTHVLPPTTVTRYVVETVVQTVTPVASTICVTAPEATQVFTVPGPLLTQITLVTSTSLTFETVFVNETILTISNDIAAATSCLANGGSYGIQP